MFFTAALHALVRFSEDEGVVQNLVQLDDDREWRGVDPLAYVRGAARSMLYADDAGVVSKSTEEFA